MSNQPQTPEQYLQTCTDDGVWEWAEKAIEEAYRREEDPETLYGLERSMDQFDWAYREIYLEKE